MTRRHQINPEVLADIPPPVIEARREPLQLVAVEERNISDLKALSETPDIDRQELDSLHPVFPESNDVT
jgi:hypothetical protein